MKQFLEKRRMTKWRKEVLERIDDMVTKEVANHERYIAQAIEAGRIARLIVKKTNIRFDYPYIEAIGSEVKIWDGTRELVHHLAKKLHVVFFKDFQSYRGSMSYRAIIDGVKFVVKDITDIPHCKIVKKTDITETTSYELICE